MPDDADVPEQLPLDDDEIRLRIEFGAHHTGDFFNDASFNFLPLAIA